jgi:hypothetical protein
VKRVLALSERKGYSCAVADREGRALPLYRRERVFFPSLKKKKEERVMRSTQYIGLTRSAMDFIADYQRVIKSENCTHGMFDEVVALGEWVSKHDGTKFWKIKEIVQFEPWSSGPMIFTCLVGFFHNDKTCEHPISVLGWVEDPRQQGEFDCEKGTMWV